MVLSKLQIRKRLKGPKGLVVFCEKALGVTKRMKVKNNVYVSGQKSTKFS